MERKGWSWVIKVTIVCFGLQSAAETSCLQQGISQKSILDQQFSLKFISCFLHRGLPWILLPVGKVFMEFILSEELKLHQLREQICLSFPLLESNKSWSFPVEVGDSSGADGDVLSPCSVGKLNDLEIVWVLSFLEVAKFIAHASFFFDQLDEVIGGQLLGDGRSSLLQFR